MTGFAPALGLVLAGGLARRMGGGDKPLRPIAGMTILDRVLARLRPQCDRIILNANGDPSRFAPTGLPVVPDNVPGFAGPLAGILAGLDWAAEHAPGVEWIASVPGDCPFLPRDLVVRLDAARVAAGRPLACARSGEWRHPVVGLWPTRLRDDLRQALTAGRPAQDRGLDRAPWRRGGRLADAAGRPLLQRQHAGRCRTGRAACVAIPDRVTLRPLIRPRLCSIMSGEEGLGRIDMQSFIAACVVAVVVALGAAVVLNHYNASAEQAYSSSTGART